MNIGKRVFVPERDGESVVFVVCERGVVNRYTTYDEIYSAVVVVLLSSRTTREKKKKKHCCGTSINNNGMPKLIIIQCNKCHPYPFLLSPFAPARM